MTALVKYEAARQALAEAHSVDEVKGIHDKAEAMRAYAVKAKDLELVWWAAELKLDAERKGGRMLVQMDLPASRPTKASQRATLSDYGITRSQSSRWQALANVPEEEFEAALVGEEKPTMNGIIAKPPTMPDTSLWLWGRLRDFERDGLLDMNSDEATELMTDAMLADVRDSIVALPTLAQR